MASKEFLESLFTAHVADLRDVVPDIEDAFVCPICWGKFSREDIYAGKLSDGHVWPQYLREKSHATVEQHVLLCKSCNNIAGARGDNQMQLLERIREHEKTGHYYGERNIIVLPGHFESPIKLRGQVAHLDPQDKRKIDLQFPLGRINPYEHKRFQELEKQGGTFSLQVHPHNQLSSELARAGWITSAYLLAFYTFGYRYIFHWPLNQVRQYILASFEKDAKHNLELPKVEPLSARFCGTHFSDDPVIKLMLPLKGKTPVHLQIDFLDCHIELPFPCRLEVLQYLIGIHIPDPESLGLDINDPDPILYIPIQCKKTEEHDCVWDYVLGKLIPSEEEE